jgi:RimJ/RimL family protein N-acetyltransferase
VLLRSVQPAADAEALFAESHPPAGDPEHWVYLFDGPYRDAAEYERALRAMETSRDPMFFTVVVGGRPAGIVSYLRITPVHGVIEIGNIWFGASLRRRPPATEAIFLLAGHAFDTLGYRRLEWKCNALNAPSRRAALRYGFRFEGIFEHHMVIKGRNRDTAWYAMTDDEWPAVRSGFERWLAPENFDGAGHQRRRLADLIHKT